MAGRAAAPLPRSARSQPPALRAPLSLLLSPALGGGGSSLLGSLAPVIRGAGLGGRSPRPRRGTPGGERRARPEPGRPPAPLAQAQGRGPGPHDPDQGSLSERRGSLPPTGSEPVVSYRHVSYVCQEPAVLGPRTPRVSWPSHLGPMLPDSFRLSLPAWMGEHGCSE